METGDKAQEKEEAAPATVQNGHGPSEGIPSAGAQSGGGERPQLGPEDVMLSTVLHRMLYQSNADIHALAEACANLKGRERSMAFMNWIESQRQQYIRFLVLVQWATGKGSTESCEALFARLKSREEQLTRVADSLYFMRENLAAARAPFYDVATAVDVLSSGTYLRLPVSIRNKFVQEQAKGGEEADSVLERLNDVLYRRLFASVVPEEFTTIRVEDGTVVCLVQDEFEVTITLDGPRRPWIVLALKMFVKGRTDRYGVVVPEEEASLIKLLQKKMIEAESDPPTALRVLFTVTHTICVRLVMNLLNRQATNLLSLEGMDQNLKVRYTENQCLAIHYWCDRVQRKPSRGAGTVEDAFSCLQIVVNHDMKICIFHQPAIVGVVSFEGLTDATDGSPTFKLNPSSLDVEELIMTAVRMHTAARLIELHSLLPAPHARTSPDNQRLEMHLYARHVLAVTINKHSGRIELELTRDSAQRVCSSHKLRELESTVNGGVDALPTVADFLMRQSILERIEHAAGALGGDCFRACTTPLRMSVSEQCNPLPFEINSDRVCYCRFPPWTELLLAIYITDSMHLDLYLLCTSNNTTGVVQCMAAHILDQDVPLPSSSPHVTSVGPTATVPSITFRQRYSGRRKGAGGGTGKGDGVCPVRRETAPRCQSVSMLELLTEYGNGEVLGLFSFCLELDRQRITYQVVEQRVSFSLDIPLTLGRSDVSGKWVLYVPLQGTSVECVNKSIFDGTGWSLTFPVISRSSLEVMKQQMSAIEGITSFLMEWKNAKRVPHIAEFFQLNHVTDTSVYLSYGVNRSLKVVFSRMNRGARSVNISDKCNLISSFLEVEYQASLSALHLLEGIMHSFDPLQALKYFTTPSATMMEGDFLLLPRSSMHVRAMFRQKYGIDVRFLKRSEVLIEDAGRTRGSKLNPIPNFGHYMSQFANTMPCTKIAGDVDGWWAPHHTLPSLFEYLQHIMVSFYLLRCNEMLVRSLNEVDHVVFGLPHITKQKFEVNVVLAEATCGLRGRFIDSQEGARQDSGSWLQMPEAKPNANALSPEELRPLENLFIEVTRLPGVPARVNSFFALLECPIEPLKEVASVMLNCKGIELSIARGGRSYSTPVSHQFGAKMLTLGLHKVDGEREFGFVVHYKYGEQVVEIANGSQISTTRGTLSSFALRWDAMEFNRFVAEFNANRLLEAS